MEIYVKIYFVSIFSIFLVFNHDFIIYTLILSQLQTQQLMTSQIRTHRVFNTNIQGG